MLFATFVFFILCLFHYKSIITSLYYSVICIVLMQVGYVGGVLFLVWREAKSRRAR
ncbi:MULTISPECIES: exopolysaccharide production repressor protein [unclassified Rhizobium]|uniref:exopolysaccharide production repressor protein n=1 Tax=unclassified Rhizobium TaxID=2613769 RepID=UPI001FDA26F3|nr:MULTISPECIES: exopolysaccharide production repressor protein [unclassified Rhizobium]